jgi:hypothetical protein
MEVVQYDTLFTLGLYKTYKWFLLMQQVVMHPFYWDTMLRLVLLESSMRGQYPYASSYFEIPIYIIIWLNWKW